MLTRREMMKLGLLSASALPLGRVGAWADELPPSPPTTPFVDPLPIPPVLQPVSYLEPAPPQGPHPFQRYYEFPSPPPKLYEMHVSEDDHWFHRDLPPSRIWGYNGIVPGPTFIGRYTEPALVRFHNELPPRDVHRGPGSPEITTHLHNLHTGSESDGFPGDWFPKGPEETSACDRPWPYRYKDNYYPHIYAGADETEALGTLWYHDHREGFTAPNVYKGLAGFYLLLDKIDSGNEMDPNPKALRLPGLPVLGPAGNVEKLEFDIPMIFADKAFDTQGKVFFNQFNLDGHLGDKFTVNGKIQPYFKVARRRYRFRLLDGGPSRFYEFCLRKGRWNATSAQIENLGGLEQFFQIANDGNLLPKALQVDSVRLGVAERADVIVDFADYQVGDELFLMNRLEQVDGRGPTGKILDPGTPLVRFVVDRDIPGGPGADPSRDVRKSPDLRPLPPLPISKVRLTRTWEFNRSNGAWQVNGKFFNECEVRADPKLETAEIWVLKNGGGGWSHPIHIHFEEFRILSRNGQPPPPHEQGRKDVVVLGPGAGEEVVIFIQFRDFRGRYVMHCHNTVHEDHEMMVRWDIVP